MKSLLQLKSLIAILIFLLVWVEAKNKPPGLFSTLGTAEIDSWVVTSPQPIQFPSPIKHLVTKTHQKPFRSQLKRDAAEAAESYVYIYRVDNDQNLTGSSEKVRSVVGSSVARSKVQIEPNIRFSLSEPTYQTGTTSWALDRLDQLSLPLNDQTTRHHLINGSGVDVYIVDTGIYQHPTFLHPIHYDVDVFRPDNPTHDDPEGHGTHVACLEGSSVYGVASDSIIHSIKVLDEKGGGYLDDVLDGLYWIAAHTTQPSIISMSLGSNQASPLMTALINAMTAQGHIFIVAAGNDYGGNACNSYPANLDAVIAVAASDAGDGRAVFTSIGPCVDIYAPGDSIVSCQKFGSGATYKSGSSMSTPLVAAVAALILQAKRMYPHQMPYGSTAPVRSILMQFFAPYNAKLKAPLLTFAYETLYQDSTSVPPAPFSKPPPLSLPNLPPPPPPLPPIQPLTNGSADKEDESAIPAWFFVMWVVTFIIIVFL